MSTRLLHGDCREVLKTLPDASVHCVVTSPPYFGLRDYGTGQWTGGEADCDHKPKAAPRLARPANGLTGGKSTVDAGTILRDACHCGATRTDSQIGLEATPDAYVAEMVAVFREVRRVLRNDGTLWLNLGDSYSGSMKGSFKSDAAWQQFSDNAYTSGNTLGQRARTAYSRSSLNPPGLKTKDLIGIPWAVATALRDPYYTGRIKSELDRVWMAAMIDGEGTICGFRHVRPDGNVRTGCLVFITNGSEAILDNCERIWPGARYQETLKVGDTVLGGVATRPCWRWQIQMAEDRSLFLREIYPYLVEKRKQAIIGYALCEIAVAAKRYGRGGDANGLKEKRDLLVGLLSDLNNRRACDLPGWIKEPPSPTEPGYYLRQDIIWSKNNPMPESVRDRCTKAHEYLFLLSKSPRYFWDAEAIAEVSIRAGDIPGGGGHSQPDAVNDQRIRVGLLTACQRPVAETRNKRSVWEVATQPFSEAHFATFPPALIEPCILAGCPAKACEKCGKPWVREVEREAQCVPARSGGPKTAGIGIYNSPDRPGGFYPVPPKTLGFSPSCSCNAATVPGTVLDPFAGAGTTGLVADRLGRNAILIELNAGYADMSHRRIVDDAPLFAEVAVA